MRCLVSAGVGTTVAVRSASWVSDKVDELSDQSLQAIKDAECLFIQTTRIRLTGIVQRNVGLLASIPRCQSGGVIVPPVGHDFFVRRV